MVPLVCPCSQGGQLSEIKQSKPWKFYKHEIAITFCLKQIQTPVQYLKAFFRQERGISLFKYMDLLYLILHSYSVIVINEISITVL